MIRGRAAPRPGRGRRASGPPRSVARGRCPSLTRGVHPAAATPPRAAAAPPAPAAGWPAPPPPPRPS
ncbi:hypothetical protein E2C05_27835, partial [Paracraurococcus ruber]